MSYRWVEDSPTIHRLFIRNENGDTYVGKLFYTVVGGAVVKVTFVTIDHVRMDIPLGEVACGGARRAVLNRL